jgi:hypothetical protein
MMKRQVMIAHPRAKLLHVWGAKVKLPRRQTVGKKEKATVPLHLKRTWMTLRTVTGIQQKMKMMTTRTNPKNLPARAKWPGEEVIGAAAGSRFDIVGEIGLLG